MEHNSFSYNYYDFRSFQSIEKRMKISDMTITDSGPGIRKFKMKKKHFTYGVLGIKIGECL